MSSLWLVLLPLLGWGQATLTNTGTYTENFNNIGSTAPTGFSVVTGATTTALGTSTTYLTAGTAANSTTGNFRNVISGNGYTNANYPTSSTTTTGASFTDRALAVKQTASIGDPGAGFVAQFSNTTGYTGFTLSFKLQQLDLTNTARATTFRVDYGLGASPTTFTAVTPLSGSLITTAGTFTNNTITVNFGSALDNQTGPVYIRIVTIAATTGSGTRPTTGIDDFTLSYATTPPTTSSSTSDPTGTPVCATSGASITIPFTPSGTFNSGNTFTAQLSSASGSFASPTTLITTASTSTSLTVTIPNTVANGTGYLVRIIGSDPATTGAANTTAFTIVNNPTVVIAPSTAQTIAQGSSINFTGTETPTATSREWLYGTTLGSYTTSTGNTTTNYTFTPTATGTYYVVLRSVFPGCGIVTSTATQVTVTVPVPALVLSSAALTAFSTTTGTPSTAQSYTLTGSNLAGDVTVTPPVGYEVSQTSATTGFGGDNTAITILQSDATTGKTIYVRLTGATAGSFGTSSTPVTITHASTGANTVNKSVYGTVTAPTPVITVAPTTALSFATTTGTPSAEQSYTVNATNLTANLMIMAPAGYEISLTSGTYTGTGGNTLMLTPSSGTVASTIIYVRLTAATAGSFSGSVSNASTGATTRNISVSGTVTAPVAPALATYSLAALTTGRAPSAPATAKDANISTAADLTRGAGINNSSGSTNPDIFGATGWSTVANLAAAQTGDKFFAFAITPTFGYLVNVTSINGYAYRTSTAPNTIELLYSTSSDFSNPVSLGTQTITSTLAPGAAFSFSSAAAPQNVAGPVYFRIYGYGSTSASANFYFSENGSSPGLVVNGTTSLTTTPLIATNTINPTAICGGSNVVVNYATAGPASTGTYVVQLSDATGSFATPTTLTTVSSTSTSLTVNVPATTANGTAYKMRVVNTDGTTGSASAVLTIVSNPTAMIVPGAAQSLNIGTSGTTLTVTETPAGVSRQWLFATTSGGSYTAISGATGLTYTPSFTTAGTYYVVAQSTFAACGTFTSNEVVVTVTAPALVAAPTALTGFTTSTGSVSAAQTYILTGTGVLAPVTVSAPNGYEVSLDGTTFAASVSASAASVNTGQTISVRLLGSTTGSVSGNVTNTVGSVTVSVAVSGSVVVPPGLLLAEDNFDYNGALNANSWTGSGASITQAGNITAAMFPQGILATGGTSYQARIVGTSGSTLARVVTTIPNGTTTLYAAALINVSTAATVSGDDFVFAFLTTSGGSSAVGRVTIARPSSALTTKFVFRLRSSNSGTATANSAQFDINTPYILVLKAENSDATGNSDQFSLYVLPASADLSQEPSSPMLTVSGVNFFGTIGAFQLRLSDANNPILSMDNFRFATGWGAAVGNVSYSALTSSINPGSYYNLTSSNNGQVAQTGAVTVENQLALAGGRLALNGQTLTLAGTLAGNGTLTGSAASNLVVLGTGALGTLNFTANSQALNNLTLNRAGTATLGSPLTVSGTLALTNGTLTTTATNVPTLSSAATVTGGSATSFINGPLRRTVGNVSAATPVTFPIGKGSAYRPLALTINGQTSNTIYQAEQFNQSGGTNVDATLQRVSQVRFFSVTPYSATTPTVVEQPSGFTGTLTLNFGGDDQVTNPTATSFVMGKRSTSTVAWTSIGGSGTGSAGGGTITSGAFNSFSDFALASTDPDATINPLPVQLISFTATRATTGVQVAWATASEKNSDYFVVERSLDGRVFTSVAKVAAHGTTALSHTYASLDAAAPAALLYYRLRQVDLDGTVAYSPVVTVAATDGAIAEFALAPNPARESVSFLTAVPTAYTVHNTLGQLVRSGTTAAGTNSLQVSELPAGVYFFELHGSAGRVVRKFVKE